MNEVNLLLSQNPKFKFVGIEFRETAKVYPYKTVLDVEVGDKVLVPCGDGVDQIIKMVSVVVVGDETPEVATGKKHKWIIQKVDMTHFKECLEVERTVTKELNALRTNRIRKEYLQHLETQIGDDGIKLLGDSISNLGGENVEA